MTTQETQFILTMVLLFGGIIYVTAMFVFRKLSEGEKFDLAKYAQTLGYVAIVAIMAYLATGALPNFEEILANLFAVGIPSIDAILTLATALLLGIIQKLFKLQGAKTGTVVATPATPKPTTGGQNAGKGKVLGIYGGSAMGATPQQSVTFDINMIPTLFFNVATSSPGPVGMQLIIDGIIQKKWMPDFSSNDAMVIAKFPDNPSTLPFAFTLFSNFRVAGEHTVSIRLGYVDNEGKNPVWTSLDTYKITLTGTPFTE